MLSWSRISNIGHVLSRYPVPQVYDSVPGYSVWWMSCYILTRIVEMKFERTCLSDTLLCKNSNAVILAKDLFEMCDDVSERNNDG